MPASSFFWGGMNKGFNYDLFNSSTSGFPEAEASHSYPDILTAAIL
jgi:hypothetical protein